MILLYIYLLGVVVAFLMLTIGDIQNTISWIQMGGDLATNLKFLLVCILMNIAISAFSWYHVYKEIVGEVPHG